MRNVEELAKEFPKQFKDGGTPCQSSYPEGWHDLIRNVCKRVDAGRIPITWAQIKEKFGSLRMYEDVPDGHSALVEVYDWIGEAERLSMITCQSCGNKGKQEVLRGWRQVLCGPCKARQTAH